MTKKNIIYVIILTVIACFFNTSCSPSTDVDKCWCSDVNYERNNAFITFATLKGDALETHSYSIYPPEDRDYHFKEIWYSGFTYDRVEPKGSKLIAYIRNREKEFRTAEEAGINSTYYQINMDGSLSFFKDDKKKWTFRRIKKEDYQRFIKEIGQRIIPKVLGINPVKVREAFADEEKRKNTANASSKRRIEIRTKEGYACKVRPENFQYLRDNNLIYQKQGTDYWYFAPEVDNAESIRELAKANRLR